MVEVVNAASLTCWPSKAIDTQACTYNEDSRPGEWLEDSPSEEEVSDWWTALTSTFSSAQKERAASSGEDADVPSGDDHCEQESKFINGVAEVSCDQEVPSRISLSCSPFASPVRDSPLLSLADLLPAGWSPSAASTSPVLKTAKPSQGRQAAPVDQELRNGYLQKSLSEQASYSHQGASSPVKPSPAKNWTEGKELWLQRRAAWLGVPLSEVADEPETGMNGIEKDGELQAFQLGRLVTLRKSERAERREAERREAVDTDELAEEEQSSDSDGVYELSDGEVEAVRSAVRRNALFGVEYPLKETAAPFGRPLPLTEVSKYVEEVWRNEEPEAFARYG